MASAVSREELEAQSVARLGIRLSDGMSDGKVADAVLAHERLVERCAQPLILGRRVRDAHDVPMAQIPEVLEGETRPHVTIRIDARERSGPDAIGDPDDVAVVGRQVG